MQQYLAAFGRGTAILLGCFGLDQGLMSFGINIRTLGFSLPLVVSLAINLWLLVELLLIAKRPREQQEEPPTKQTLGDAVIAFASELSGNGKWAALLELRHKISRTLHLMGLHADRVRLGELAVNAAIRLNDLPSRAEILIDDLGWARHLAGKDAQAIECIKLAIKLLDEAVFSDIDEQIRMMLLSAKGFRHLANVDESNDPEDFLTEAYKRIEAALALAIANNAQQAFSIEIERDRAQIAHSKALAVASRLGVSQGGDISPRNLAAKQEAENAISSLIEAARSFQNAGDLERTAKVLTLHVRLLTALGRTIEAEQLAIRRDHMIAASRISNPTGYLGQQEKAK